MKNAIITAAALLFSFAFFACKRELPGTTTTHGYRFVNYTNKTGDKVSYGQKIKVHVETWMGDSLLMSTYKMSPDGAPMDQLIPEESDLAQAPTFPPVYDALLLMAPGDSASIFQKIDSNLIQFVPEKMKGKVKEIKYNIMLVSAQSKAEMEAEKVAIMSRHSMLQNHIAEFKAGKYNGKMSISPNKVKVYVLEAGNGERIKSSEQVSVDYVGARINDGKVFDESFKRGQPLTYSAGVGQMIKGFDEAVMSLKHGAKAVIFLPASEAYGAQGAGADIPPNTDISFYIEVK